MTRADRIRRANEAAADAQQRADAHRKETNEGIRNARGSRHQKPDTEFIRNWKPQRDADQEYLDDRARETAKDAAKARRRWW